MTWSWGVVSEELPPIHRDPFDRMLVSQARTGAFTLVTEDAQVSAYDVPVLWELLGELHRGRLCLHLLHPLAVRLRGNFGRLDL